MKVWIIGRRGILASAMKRKCEERHIPYFLTSRKEVDLENEDAVRAQFGTLEFTHVINCCGYTAVDQAEREKEKAYALNAKAVGLLAKLSQEKGNKLIHFSTDYVFNGEKGRYHESDLRDPLSEYGKSKEAGERLLFEHYPEALLVRTSWLFGKEGTHFVKKMIELMEEKEELGVVNDQKGRPNYADDLAEAVLTLLDQSGIFHFANEGETTWHGFAEAIHKKLAEKKEIRCKKVEPVSSETFGTQAMRPRSSILETTHFSPRHWSLGLEEVLEHALRSQ
jgi:dTDP-4-dehydrorhamnose reductase